MSANEDSSERRTVAGLLSAARSNDENALGHLLSQQATYLRWIANTCLDARIRQRVSESDIVQETFARAVKHFADFRGKSAAEFRAWMRTILINCANREVERHLMTTGRDARREVSLQAIQQRVDDSTIGFAKAFAADGHSPGSEVAAHEQASMLMELVEGLPESQRECVKLRHREGLRFSEIATRMGCNESTVRMRYLRAVQSVRKEVAKRGGQ